MPALDEVSPAQAVAAAPAPPRPAWQRWRLFRFIGSLQLAVILLAVIIVAIIFGTIYESRFDADVARAYIYGAAWFNLWLLFLAVNLAASAFSRWPWQRRHTGFLITHLGIIVLLVGALIGRTWGVEGTMTLFKGRGPDNRLLVQQRQLYVTEEDASRQPVTFPVQIVGRRPSAAKPWSLGKTPGGWKVELTDYAPHLTPNFQPEVPTIAGVVGQPATRIRLASPRLGRTMERWLLAGDDEHNVFDLGMASVRLVAGPAPGPISDGKSQTPNPNSQTPEADTVDESVVAFAKHPGEQAGQTAPGKTASGAKVRLTVNGNRRLVSVEWRGAAWEFDADADRGKEEDLGNSGLFVRIGELWPDFTLKDGQPATASDQPNNPAVLVRVHGRLTVPADAAGESNPAALPAGTAGAGDNGAPNPENAATLYCDAATGALTYSLRSGAAAQPVRGTLTPGQSVNTGWADWQLSVDKVLPQAIDHTIFEPSETRPKGGPMQGGSSGPVTDGVRVRLSRDGQPTHEQWVAAGWQVVTPTRGGNDRPLQLVYGWQIEPLPIGLELTKFEVERNEGTDDPAGFKSTLRVTGNDGTTDTGSCWMNNPHNFPRGPLFTWTGLTYKISQASWNPDNLDQSSVQILRDPGWSLKWIGCLLVCLGIATLFYGRPHPGETAAARARLAKP